MTNSKKMGHSNEIIHSSSDSLQLSDVIGQTKSALMQDFFKKVGQLAKIEKNVIIIGEIGSGKKRVAQIIHANSNRAQKPLYSFYCMDVDEMDYKDAFWEKLKFDKNHITLEYDLVEKAAGGTLYLDKFSALPIRLMIDIVDSYLNSCKQLYRYVATEQPRLIISLSQESYHEILDTKVWRKLLKKLDPVAIIVPPLRERKEDIPFFIDSFLKQIQKITTDSENLSISEQALQECMNYSWPGNIRQLKNAMYHAAILSHCKKIESSHLPFSMKWSLPYEIDDQKKPGGQ